MLALSWEGERQVSREVHEMLARDHTFLRPPAVIERLQRLARPILDALGKNMIGVEKEFDGLSQNPSWQLVQQDMTFLRRITRDAIRRARTGLGDLRPGEVVLRAVADEVLDMCKRYFLDLAHYRDVTLVNACVMGRVKPAT